MPPTPRPKLRTSAPSSASKAQTSAGSPGDKTSGQSPAASPRRTPKVATLRDKLVRFYMMIGTILVPFGRFIPQLVPIGQNLKVFSEEAADAWIDLAEEDAKVKSYLESLVGASTWGNVIGVHFAIFMSAMPQQMAKVAETIVPEGKDPVEVAKSFGLTEDEVDKAFKMAENMVSDRPPEPPVTEVQRMNEESAKLRQKAKDNSKSGIVSPDELGVQNKGEFYNGPQITGGMP